MSIGEYINLDVRELKVPFIGKELTVSSEDSSNIVGASVLVFRAKGYETYDQAYAAACKLRDCLSLAFLDIGIGADLVDRGPEGYTTEEGKKWVREQFGINENTELRDNRNLDIYEEASEVKHLRTGARLSKLHSGEAFKEKIKTYIENGRKLNDEEANAFNLFSLSKMQQNEDMIRYLLSFMAIESLVKRELRDDIAVEDIKKAIQTIEDDASYGEVSKNVMRTTLENVKQESINSAFKRLIKPALLKLDNVADADALIHELIEVRGGIAHKGKLRCKEERLSELITILTNVLKHIILSEEIRNKR